MKLRVLGWVLLLLVCNSEAASKQKKRWTAGESAEFFYRNDFTVFLTGQQRFSKFFKAGHAPLPRYDLDEKRLRERAEQEERDIQRATKRIDEKGEIHVEVIWIYGTAQWKRFLDKAEQLEPAILLVEVRRAKIQNAELMRLFKNFPKLKSLKLETCDAGKEILPAFQTAKSLRGITFEDMKISYETAKNQIPQWMSVCVNGGHPGKWAQIRRQNNRLPPIVARANLGKMFGEILKYEVDAICASKKQNSELGYTKMETKDVFLLVDETGKSVMSLAKKTLGFKKDKMKGVMLSGAGLTKKKKNPNWILDGFNSGGKNVRVVMCKSIRMEPYTGFSFTREGFHEWQVWMPIDQFELWAINKKNVLWRLAYSGHHEFVWEKIQWNYNGYISPMIP